MSTCLPSSITPSSARSCARTLETERLDDANRQRADLARDLRDDGSSSGPGATACAGSDEHHVGSLHEALDAIVIAQSCLPADRRVEPNRGHA